MKKIDSTFDPELFIAPKLVVVGLVFWGMVLILSSDYLVGPAESFKAVRLGLLTEVLAIIAWLLSKWRPEIGRGFIIVALVFVVFAGILWFESKVFMSLLVMPVALAAILSGPFAVAATAVSESALVIILSQLSLIEADTGSIVFMMVAIWAMVGIIFSIYHPLYEITQWSWTNYGKARDLLEEVRDQKVELQQALADLAHAYRELDLLNERVTAMRLVAEEAQAAKTAFVAKVSHEFRTPLNMIIGLTNVLMETPEVYGDNLSSALLDDLKIVHRNCEHLSKMVNDILDLSQTEVGRLTLRREWTNLAEDIEVALGGVRPLLEKKHLSLRANLPGDLPQVYCDRTRISQVILNLVSNAARFTDQGGITVSARQQDQYITVSVADTGPGVLPEDAERIFEPFCQGRGNPWREQKGSGLGLSISKQFVELHGGQMWLESPPSIPPSGGDRKGGPGSTFSFKLPISPPTSPTATAARWINQNWVWHERTSKSKIPQLPYKQRVLICDETDDLYDLLTHCSDEIEFIKTDKLEQAIYEAQAVPAHAVVINTASNHEPALAPNPSLDYPGFARAGGREGQELLIEQVRRKLPDTPIIMGAFPSRISHVFEAGAINYLIKPIMRLDLENAMNAIGQPIRSVLIADDDPDLRQLLRRMLLLYDDGLKVITASSGQEALTQLRRSGPDLMLIDIIMPGMDGWQTLEQKKQDESIKDIPAIIISAQDLTGQPLTSPTLLATIGAGISVDKFLRCSLELSTLLLEPD